MAFRVEWLFPHLVSIAIAILMALAAWKRPSLGRGLFAVLFLWASLVNGRLAIRDPAAYLEYANLTESPVYRGIIEGPFARHITGYVMVIALGQLCIAIGMLLRGLLTRTACVGAIIFLVAIAPLGIGAAFPATLIMAGGAAVLLRARFDRTLWAEIRTALGGRGSRQSTA
jgi:hypothetical protein